MQSTSDRLLTHRIRLGQMITQVKRILVSRSEKQKKMSKKEKEKQKKLSKKEKLRRNKNGNSK
jgi:hypothetical protein